MTLNCRDSNGFIVGSAAQRDYLEAVERQRQKREAREARKREAAEAIARAARAVDIAKFLPRLDRPEWWDSTTWGQRRLSYARARARSKAREAARLLGVDVPDWVTQASPRRRYGLLGGVRAQP